METYITRLPNIDKNDAVEVGYENAFGKEKCSQMSDKGIKVLDGFVITTTAFKTILSFNSMHLKLYDIMQQLDKRNYLNLDYVGNLARKLFEKALIPYKLRFTIEQAYNQLLGGKNNLSVAIKSFLIYEDAPQKKFENQCETYSNLNSETLLMEAIKKAFASLYSDPAIKFREENGIPHHKMSLAIKIQKERKLDTQIFARDNFFKPDHTFKTNLRNLTMQVTHV